MAGIELSQIREWITFGVSLLVILITFVTGFVNLNATVNTLTDTTTVALNQIRDSDTASQADRAGLHAEINALDKRVDGLLIEFRRAQEEIKSSVDKITRLELELTALRVGHDRIDRPAR